MEQNLKSVSSSDQRTLPTKTFLTSFSSGLTYVIPLRVLIIMVQKFSENFSKKVSGQRRLFWSKMGKKKNSSEYYTEGILSQSM